MRKLFLVFFLLGLASPARANYIYQIFDDGVAQTGQVTPGGNAFSTTLSTTNFQGIIGSSFTTISPLLTVLTTNLQAQLNPPGGTHTITIELNYSGYTQPGAGRLLASTSGQANITNSTTSDMATFQAWADANNSNAFQAGVTGGVQ